jgi:hypothetical protein
MALVLQWEVFYCMNVFILLGIDCNRIFKAGLNEF